MESGKHRSHVARRAEHRAQVPAVLQLPAQHLPCRACGPHPRAHATCVAPGESRRCGYADMSDAAGPQCGQAEGICAGKDLSPPNSNRCGTFRRASESNCFCSKRRTAARSGARSLQRWLCAASCHSRCMLLCSIRGLRRRGTASCCTSAPSCAALLRRRRRSPFGGIQSMAACWKPRAGVRPAPSASGRPRGPS